MHGVVGAQQKSVRADLAEADISHRRVGVCNVYRPRPAIKLPLDGGCSARIVHGSGKRGRSRKIDNLVGAGIDTRRSWRPWTSGRAGCLDHLEIVDVDRRKMTEGARGKAI